MSKPLSSSQIVMDLNAMKSTLFGIDQTKQRFIDDNILVVGGTAKHVDSNTDIYGSRSQDFYVVTEDGYFVNTISQGTPKWITRENTLGKWQTINFNYTDNRILNHSIVLERIYNNRTIIGCFKTLKLDIEDRAVFLNYTGVPLPENWSDEQNQSVPRTPDYYLNTTYFNRPVNKHHEEFQYATSFYLTSGKISYVIIEHWKDKLVRTPQGNEWIPHRHYTILNPIAGAIVTKVAPRLTKEVLNELS